VNHLRLVMALLTCGLSAALWLHNFFRSPAGDPARKAERDSLRATIQHLAPNLAEERELAQAYWQRYPDVLQDGFWGERSPMGIRGPRDHFRQYGRHEGRVFGPIPKPDEPAAERNLAEAYWNRYPDIAGNDIWGRAGTLGVQGARDHYHYYGKAQGRIWEVNTP